MFFPKPAAWYVIYQTTSQSAFDQMEAARLADLVYNQLHAAKFLTAAGKKEH